ncbi:MAG TPA: magnesium/cobalt transporter CorA [Anaerohalosphaeraceae bacterium]|jgi:magnesium transporter|nr:magnesium/cobalt transporter CorA [Anaerohalosphaeraceae bacterium]HRT50176.1 magnesium/cobalt transporter CorA [Anaerohalosphaeraceae bacterium]HRT86107.1 magnesium/cobalt transporter CorA [Anaerohalosphaeraceae bacterium]
MKANRNNRRLSKKAGLPPGTLVHVGERRTEKVRITVMDYDEAHFQEKEVASVEECMPFKAAETVTWINIDGLHEVNIIARSGAYFDLHPLILEDILHTTQRPRFQDCETYLYVVLQMLSYNAQRQRVESEQVSLILGEGFVLTFQERVGDVFDVIRDRIRKAGGRIRKAGADYLLYSLIDAVVDNYFNILENFGDRLETLEEDLFGEPSEGLLQRVHLLKRDLIALRRSVWPVRELVNALDKTESKLITKTTHTYLRDLYDHTIQVIETVETFRDVTSGLQDIYLSSISNRMNAVMKMLTIIATVFIPLTFIAGVYGMNFRHMPELEWRYGYMGVWAVMIGVATVMLVYFMRKKWL